MMLFYVVYYDNVVHYDRTTWVDQHVMLCSSPVHLLLSAVIYNLTDDVKWLYRFILHHDRGTVVRQPNYQNIGRDNVRVPVSQRALLAPLGRGGSVYTFYT